MTANAGEGVTADADAADGVDSNVEQPETAADQAASDGDSETKPKRRRPRRRRSRKSDGDITAVVETATDDKSEESSADGDETPMEPAHDAGDGAPAAAEPAELPVEEDVSAEPVPAEPLVTETIDEPVTESAPVDDDAAVNGEEEVTPEPEEPAESAVQPPQDPDRPRRSGWWSRPSS